MKNIVVMVGAVLAIALLAGCQSAGRPAEQPPDTSVARDTDRREGRTEPDLRTAAAEPQEKSELSQEEPESGSREGTAEREARDSQAAASGAKPPAGSESSEETLDPGPLADPEDGAVPIAIAAGAFKDFFVTGVGCDAPFYAGHVFLLQIRQI